ncbi:hypothetical protein [Xanthomonas sp. 4461]|uniref:hypothetical protein n=1 Tax=Xanthomonas sp. 4461 TaxID=3035313 RepID=UPI00216939B6|nr:hypothetical protein [Xanthomonas sp. 4461]MCS3809982.1 hypothetical protein [Xanthomonas sp. 4461]
MTDLLESGHQPMMVRTSCLDVHANDAAPRAPGSRLRWMEWLVCMRVRQVRVQAVLRKARTLPAGFWLCKHFMKIIDYVFSGAGSLAIESAGRGWIRLGVVG